MATETERHRKKKRQILRKRKGEKEWGKGKERERERERERWRQGKCYKNLDGVNFFFKIARCCKPIRGVRYRYVPNPSTQTGGSTRSIFWAEFYLFEFRAFLLQNWLLYQGQRHQFILVFTQSFGKNRWMHTLWSLYELQKASSRIWTRMAYSTFQDKYYYWRFASFFIT